MERDQRSKNHITDKRITIIFHFFLRGICCFSLSTCCNISGFFADGYMTQHQVVVGPCSNPGLPSLALNNRENLKTIKTIIFKTFLFCDPAHILKKQPSIF
jgi:hypothetical protein